MKPRIKPRNPFVACAKFRKAGPHEKPAKAQRRQDKLVLCKVVKQLPEHWHKRSFLEFASANASAPSGCGALVARLAWDEEVAGSRPATLTILPRWCPPRGLPSGRSGSTRVSKTLGGGSIPSRGARNNCLSGVSGLRACLKSRRLPFDSAGRHQNNRAVAERSKASVCKTEGKSPRRFESVLHVQTEQWCS